MVRFVSLHLIITRNCESESRENREEPLLIITRLTNATCFACVVLVELRNLLTDEVGDVAVSADSLN
jgi:hypothetical protein